MTEVPRLPLHQIQIDRGRLRIVLLVLNTIFMLISFSLAAIRITTGHDVVFGLVKLFSLNQEGNIPAWYSSILLFAGASVAGLVGVAIGGARSRGWKGIALVLAFFSLDEIASFHERLAVPREYLGQLAPVRDNTWVFVGVVVVGVLVVMFLRTVLASPPPIRRAVLVAGAIYAGGALGMEVLGGIWSLGHGRVNWVYAVIGVLEEGGELLGATLFLDAGLKYLETLGVFSVRVR